MEIRNNLSAAGLAPSIRAMFILASDKTLRLSHRWEVSMGAPVVTVDGQYVGRNWTQWTQGFSYGNAILCYDATDHADLLKVGRGHTHAHMAEHLTHTGVHDH